MWRRLKLTAVRQSGKEWSMKEAAMKNGKESFMSNKTGRMIALIVGEFILALIWLMFLRWNNPHVKAVYYQDSLAFGLIVAMMLFMLIFTGTIKNFGLAFVYCVAKNAEVTLSQIKTSLFAVKLSMVTALLTSISMSIMMVIDILSHLYIEQAEMWGFMFSVPCINVLYGVLAVMLLLPIYARRRVMALKKE